ncbi:hypothetical protein CLV49_0603 [Labedella gwakjiensis]|uniref:Uncharacterized protein n=1 Tax=Labedella gwakjiensis TaxID=390269 RepID=A0A2P8GSQ5_9MICO|nr:hypothetical protein [Labedella gwakjiensis]PSL37000.1 hypothetical protein CLV49_0603 [Labedella gwakjiensis]RUQ81841.1 hypothetical protein ELQ93_17590 [Labedella gwakjiensis]
MKKIVSGSLDGADDKMLAAYDTAVAALEGLYAAHAAYQGKITDAATTLDRAGIRAPGFAHEPKPDHFDPDFFPSFAYGGVASAVRVDGTTHAAGDVDRWVRQAVYGVLWNHYETQNLAGKIGTDSAPTLLENRG